MGFNRMAYGVMTPFETSKSECKLDCDLTWTLRGMAAPEWVEENWPGSAPILAVHCKGRRDGKPVDDIDDYGTTVSGP